MARPNVTVIVNDQSFVISGTESGGAHVAGFPSSEGLLFALGNTTETQQGFMRVEGTDDWFGRLKSPEPLSNYGGGSTAGGDLPFYHFTPGSTFSGQRLDPEQVNRDATGGNVQVFGSTFGYQRWPNGPTGEWTDEWWSVHNYLLYGGIAIVGATGTVTNTTSATTTLQNKSIALDSVFGVSGSASNTIVKNITDNRGDCIGVCHVPSGTGIDTSVNSPVGSASENIVSVFGEKSHVDISRLSSSVVTDTNLIQTPLSADVAGCLARTDRVANPWFSPGGEVRGRILDVVRLAKDLTDGEQDICYDNKVNPIVTFPGEGTLLFGDKTNKPNSTLSRINVARLFLYLKRVIGTSARSLLFEQNDEITRNLFINAVTPLLETIRGQRGITDFRVICDETNNTSDIIDSNQFVADVFIKPTKSINFIRLRFTNKGEGAELG
tara:strand:- start:436 stop:1749 length:1314 start_codon:yes stop_codon:yes gene_type:complete